MNETFEQENAGVSARAGTRSYDAGASAPATRTLPEAAAQLLTEFGAITVRAMWITPEIAKSWLAVMPANRRVDARHVRFLRRQLEKSLWAFNGETIVRSNRGELLDGQHRCLAGVAAGFPFYSLVVEGVPREAFDSIDASRRRSIANVYQARGMTEHSEDTAAALRLLWNHERGRDLTDHAEEQPSAREAELVRKRHPEVDTAVRIAVGLQRVTKRTGLLAALITLMLRKDEALAYRFFEDLKTGAELSTGEPVLALRDRLQALQFVKVRRTKEEHKLRADTAAVIIYAWNAARSGRRISLLKGASGTKLPPIK